MKTVISTLDGHVIEINHRAELTGPELRSLKNMTAREIYNVPYIMGISIELGDHQNE